MLLTGLQTPSMHQQQDKMMLAAQCLLAIPTHPAENGGASISMGFGSLGIEKPQDWNSSPHKTCSQHKIGVNIILHSERTCPSTQSLSLKPELSTTPSLTPLGTPHWHCVLREQPQCHNLWSKIGANVRTLSVFSWTLVPCTRSSEAVLPNSAVLQSLTYGYVSNLHHLILSLSAHCK